MTDDVKLMVAVMAGGLDAWYAILDAGVTADYMSSLTAKRIWHAIEMAETQGATVCEHDAYDCMQFESDEAAHQFWADVFAAEVALGPDVSLSQLVASVLDMDVELVADFQRWPEVTF